MKSTFKDRLPVVLTLLMGLSFTLILFVSLRKAEEQQMRTEFERMASYRSRILKKGFNDHLRVLYSVADLYSASRDVERWEFQMFVLNSLVQYPGINTLIWAPKVLQSERSHYEIQARREGLPNYLFREQDETSAENVLRAASVRPQYWPLYYVEPAEPLESFWGFDFNTSTSSRAAMDLSLESMQPVADCDFWIKSAAPHDMLISIFLPIFKNGTSTETVASRRQNILGFTVGIFNLNEVTATALEETDMTENDLMLVRVFKSATPLALLFTQGSQVSQNKSFNPAEWWTSEILHWAGEDWTVLQKPTPFFFSKHAKRDPWIILATGLLLTSFLAAYLARALNKTVEQDRLVKSTSADLLRVESTRKEAEEALTQSEERFRQLAENVRAVFWMTDLAKSEMIYVSPAYEEIWGRPPAALYENPIAWIDAIHPEDRGRVRIAAHHQQIHGTYDEEYRVLRPDGTVRWIRDRAFPIKNSAGEIYRICGVAEDISDQKSAEAELRKQTHILQSILDHMADGVAVADENENFLVFNPAAQQMLGLGATATKAEEWPQRYNLYRPDKVTPFPAEQLPLVRALHGDEVTQQEMFVARPGSEGIWISVTASPLKDEQDHLKGGIAVFRDITQNKMEESKRQQLEEQLRQSQKMEAIGTLAGGIAHDFNNMLSGILGNTDLIKLYTKPGDEIHESADAIERAAHRSAELTKQLLGFARRGKHQNLLIDLRETVVEVCKLLERTFAKNITFAQNFLTEEALVTGDPDQMHQVILNLLVNARDAMPQGGHIQIILESDQREREPIVRMAITDTGVGIPKELQERIFEPFFTTKEPGKGTGMGLAMVYGIVKTHAGEITVQSAPGRGTRFEIVLPRADPKQNTRVTVPASKAISGSGCILLIDDEDLVRDTAAKMLTQLGYDVITAANGEEAVTCYRRRHGEVDLALIDLVMPKLGGRECFRAMKKINPDLKAILVTGYAVNAVAQEILDEGMIGYVQKPYQMAQISEVVAKALQISLG